jgi:hypothetical protein
VNGSWAIALPAGSLSAAAQLRLVPGITVCQAPDGLWLRGADADDSLNQRLRLLPGGTRFTVLDDGQLVPQGMRVPLGHLPAGPWQPLADWLQVTVPAAEWATTAISPIRLSIVPSREVREPGMLLTRLTSWLAYLRTAPGWRIQRWTFAARGDGSVLVGGKPLPSIPGVQWVVDEGLATVAGTTWTPPVDARTLRQTLGLADGEVALLHSADRWDRIPAENWVRASRSAATATARSLAGATT